MHLSLSLALFLLQLSWSLYSLCLGFRAREVQGMQASPAKPCTSSIDSEVSAEDDCSSEPGAGLLAMPIPFLNKHSGCVEVGADCRGTTQLEGIWELFVL